MRMTPATQNALLLILLALFWGGAFSFIKIAVGSITPITLAAARILLAALLLAGYARFSGHRLPASGDIWRLCFAIGLTGAVGPFCLIAWGEQYIASSTTAICMALVPLTTLIFAHFMTADEKISWPKLAGILLGFSGVFLLFNNGGSAGQHALKTSLGFAAILLAVIGYAISGLLAIRLKGVPRPASAAAVMISAATLILPLSLAFEHPWTLTPGWPAIGAAAVLGIFPTALAMVMLITLAERAGATFLSLSNYLVPVVGLLLGAVWLGEKIVWQAGIAFFLICSGIYITGRKTGPKFCADEVTPSKKTLNL